MYAFDTGDRTHSPVVGAVGRRACVGQLEAFATVAPIALIVRDSAQTVDRVLPTAIATGPCLWFDRG